LVTAAQPSYFNVQEFTSQGDLGDGMRLYTFAPGTTTQKTIYTDAAASVPHTYVPDGMSGQSLVLNARGELPAPIYCLPGGYDFTLKTAAGATVWTRRVEAPLADLTGAGGAALIGYTPAGTGAVVTNVQDKLREAVSVFDFMTSAEIASVKAGNLANNNAPAYAAALATGKPVYVPNGPGWKYRFDQAVVVPSNSYLYGERPLIRLADGVNNHIFRIANSATNVEIRGLTLDGNKANNSGGNGISMGGPGGTDIRIKDNYIFNCSANGISVGGTVQAERIYVTGNYVTGSEIAGISNVDDKLRYFAFDNNFTWLNNTHGVGIVAIATHGSISNNVSWDNGQGVYPTVADNVTGYNSLNTDLVIANNVCYGGGNNGIHVGGQRLTVIGNTVYNALFYGIAVFPQVGAGNGDDIVVSDNKAYNSGLSGFWINRCGSGTVSGNLARGSTAPGFLIDDCANMTITGNCAREGSSDGFSIITNCSWLTITGNNAFGNSGDGLELNGTIRSVVSSNILRNNGGWGINVAGGEDKNIIMGNIVQSNTVGQIEPPNASTKVVNNDTLETRSVASAASLTLPPGGTYFYITGTTSITSITASFSERTVTLRFEGVLTVTDGSNLILNGNFVTTFNDTITLVCDETNWYEVSRSTN